jgi:hypothetical protein
VVAGLRRARPTMDILTAPEAGTLHMLDPDVLVWAAAHDRILQKWARKLPSCTRGRNGPSRLAFSVIKS